MKCRFECVLLVFSCLMASSLSLVGSPISRPQELDQDEKLQRYLEAELTAAQAKWDLQPSEQNAIWVGRRLAYLSQMDEAIAWYEKSLEQWPDSYRLRRHLGHRILDPAGGQLDRAAKLFSEAHELARGHINRIEPDGASNSFGTPRTSMLGNLYYHYALALYFQGDFEKAAQLWKECLDSSLSDDERVGAMHWLYTSLTRIGKVEQANQILKSLPQEMDVIEYGSYYDLLKLYRGDGESDGSADALQDVGYRYGLARWAILQGDRERGVRILNEVADSPLNSAFAVMAAKLDVAAMDRESAPRR